MRNCRNLPTRNSRIICALCPRHTVCRPNTHTHMHAHSYESIIPVRLLEPKDGVLQIAKLEERKNRASELEKMRRINER